jgi:tetratricopeptide (TPR) repeat protein
MTTVKIYNSKIPVTLAALLFLIPAGMHGQTERKYIREGNREYNRSKYSESEILYRKASQNSKYSPLAIFNTGDALYRQQKYDEAGKQFTESVNLNDDNERKSEGLYNLGNSYLMADKPSEAIKAYKESLKLQPGNKEAKYNLAYAQDLLRQQQQQQQQQQDKKGQDDKKQDQQKEQDNKQDEQDKSSANDKQQQQQQQQQEKMSREDAERLLNSLANDEKNVQEKVKLAKAAKDRVKTVKNW